MTQIVVPYRGENGKQRLDTSDEARSQLALAMLGDVLAAATVTGRTLVVTDDEAGRALAAELGAEPVADAPAAAREPRSRPRSSGWATAPCSSSTPTCPASSPTTCARSRARPSSARSATSRPRTGRRTRWRCRRRSTSRRSTAAAAPPASATTPTASACRRSPARSRTSSDDVDTLDDLRPDRPAGRPADAGRDRPRAAAVKVVLLSGGVGGARFARGLVDAAGAANLTIVGNVGDDLEVLGMSVSPDLDSILYALAGLHDEERGWGRAGETWEALATVVGARRRGLVPARRPRPRPPPRADAGAARRRAAVGRHRPARAGARDRARDPAGDRRPPPHLDRHAGRELPVPGVVRRPRPPRRGRRRPLRGRARTRPRACSRRSTRPTRS